LAANAREARDILAEIFRSAPLGVWRARLNSFDGQWAFAQDSLELTTDPQVEANGYLGETATSDGTPFQLVTTPVQYAGKPASPKRAPEFNEHCDEILAEIGCDADEVMELKVAGVVA
jgi:crotonobetainyl-CoA:carnitine CoA-transferase CaiB-like acyl-CoA transferase